MVQILKTLGKCVREYKRPSILCLIFIVGEAIMECIIPFIIANLVNEIKAGIAMPRLLGYAGLLVVMAGLSLAFGALAGHHLRQGQLRLCPQPAPGHVL